MEDWKYLMANTRGVFKIKSNIFDETFLRKRPSATFAKKHYRTCLTGL